MHDIAIDTFYLSEVLQIFFAKVIYCQPIGYFRYTYICTYSNAHMYKKLVRPVCTYVEERVCNLENTIIYQMVMQISLMIVEESFSGD